MPGIRRPVLAAIVLGLAAIAGGCAVRSPSIADLQHNPGRYYDRTVKVDGVVSSSWGGSMLPVSVYRIKDGTGEVTVVSQSSRVPPRGARVTVTGRVEELAMFGGRSVGLHIREDRLRVSGRRW